MLQFRTCTLMIQRTHAALCKQLVTPFELETWDQKHTGRLGPFRPVCPMQSAILPAWPCEPLSELGAARLGWGLLGTFRGYKQSAPPAARAWANSENHCTACYGQGTSTDSANDACVMISKPT